MQVPNVWTSMLILLSEYKDVVTVNSLCFVNYKIVLPMVEISTDKSKFPILYCDDVLHKNVTTSHKVFIRNIGFIPTTFVWGTPIGNQKDGLSIKFTPQSATIKQGVRMNIDVHVTPHELGILDNIHVPCYIENLERPIMLRILCLIDDIYFTISIPNDDDKYDVVNWPPAMINDFEADYYFKNHLDDVFETVRLFDDARTNHFMQNFRYRKKNILHLHTPSSINDPMHNK